MKTLRGEWLHAARLRPIVVGCLLAGFLLLASPSVSAAPGVGKGVPPGLQRNEAKLLSQPGRHLGVLKRLGLSTPAPSGRGVAPVAPTAALAGPYAAGAASAQSPSAAVTSSSRSTAAASTVLARPSVGATAPALAGASLPALRPGARGAPALTAPLAPTAEVPPLELPGISQSGSASTEESPLAALVPAVFPLLLALLLMLLMLVLDARRSPRQLQLAAILAGQLHVPEKALNRLSAPVLERLEAEIAFDELTGVMRRGPGVEAIEREVDRARRRRTSLSLAFVDVDGLKSVNDSHGHQAGDALLRHTAEALRGRLRGQDLVFRYGGDEFVCVLPDTPRGAAETLLASIRASLANEHGSEFSVGVAELRAGESASALVARADESLYRAKAAGRHTRG